MSSRWELRIAQVCILRCVVGVLGRCSRVVQAADDAARRDRESAEEARASARDTEARAIEISRRITELERAVVAGSASRGVSDRAISGAVAAAATATSRVAACEAAAARADEGIAALARELAVLAAEPRSLAVRASVLEAMRDSAAVQPQRQSTGPREQAPRGSSSSGDGDEFMLPSRSAVLARHDDEVNAAKQRVDRRAAVAAAAVVAATHAVTTINTAPVAEGRDVVASDVLRGSSSSVEGTAAVMERARAPSPAATGTSPVVPPSLVHETLPATLLLGVKESPAALEGASGGPPSSGASTSIVAPGRTAGSLLEDASVDTGPVEHVGATVERATAPDGDIRNAVVAGDDGERAARGALCARVPHY